MNTNLKNITERSETMWLLGQNVHIDLIEQTGFRPLRHVCVRLVWHFTRWIVSSSRLNISLEEDLPWRVKCQLSSLKMSDLKPERSTKMWIFTEKSHFCDISVTSLSKLCISESDRSCVKAMLSWKTQWPVIVNFLTLNMSGLEDLTYKQLYNGDTNLKITFFREVTKMWFLGSISTF